MNFNLNLLKPDEKATLVLREIYEKYGYKKYKVSNFEEYNFYLQYKSFLTSDKILTFTDLDGRLLALKPDITLSIIKNAKVENGKTEKAYYIENVYRESKQSNTFKEINQMGLEYMGDIGTYAEAEVISLAQMSLAQISEDYVLQLGHIGFVAGLLDSLEVDGTVREKLEGFIAGKSRHELATAATLAGIGEADTARLLCICDLSGEFTATLEKAKKICTGKKMQNAIFELEQIYTAVSGENAENISLDLSLLNDTEFYDGILMAGYIKGLPRPVLAGGRYDGMMQKLGKNAGAIGFALYLDELARIVNDKKEYDVDVLILSEQCTNYAELLAQVNRLTNEGKTVRVEKNKNCEIRYKMCYNFNEKGLCEC